MPQNIAIYIVPALTDQASQCRIVAREDFGGSARDNYRREPEKWREVGLMNSRGGLVCFYGEAAHRQELKESVPLRAGLVFNFPMQEEILRTLPLR